MHKLNRRKFKARRLLIAMRRAKTRTRLDATTRRELQRKRTKHSIRQLSNTVVHCARHLRSHHRHRPVLSPDDAAAQLSAPKHQANTLTSVSHKVSPIRIFPASPCTP